MNCNFRGKRVLVVEDNFFAAMEMADVLETANAVVVGPCSNLEDAGMRVPHSDLAVLDVDVRGRTSFALADRLTSLDVPFVFFTGSERAYLPDRFSGIEIIAKPLSPEVAVQQLDTLSREVGNCSIVEVIPTLRAQARSFLSDPLAADRLVERTLQLAIDEAGPLPTGTDLAEWLSELMRRAVRTGRSTYMN